MRKGKGREWNSERMGQEKGGGGVVPLIKKAVCF